MRYAFGNRLWTQPLRRGTSNRFAQNPGGNRAALDQFRKPFQLRQGNRRTQLRHTVVVSHGGVPRVKRILDGLAGDLSFARGGSHRGVAERIDTADRRRQLLVVGGDHATLAGGHVLGTLEAKAGRVAD